MMLLHKIIIKTINDICYIYVGSILFTLRRISRLSLLSFMLGCMDGQTVFVSVYGWADSFCLCLWMGRQFLPITESYHQSKLYANCQSSLMIVSWQTESYRSLEQPFGKRVWNLLISWYQCLGGNADYMQIRLCVINRCCKLHIRTYL